MPCPQNLVFNVDQSVCDWPENVEGCGVATETTAKRKKQLYQSLVKYKVWQKYIHTLWVNSYDGHEK